AATEGPDPHYLLHIDTRCECFFPRRSPNRSTRGERHLRFADLKGNLHLESRSAESLSASAPRPQPHKSSAPKKLDVVRQYVSSPAYFRFSILRLSSVQVLDCRLNGELPLRLWSVRIDATVIGAPDRINCLP